MARGEGGGDAGGGFSVLDGAAFVAGAAVASAHLRGVVRPGDLGTAWGILGLTFAWVALTAAGPFLYLGRRYARRPAIPPRVGDRLWALLGLPWVLSSLAQTAAGRDGRAAADWLAFGLGAGVAVVCLIAIAAVWGTWVMVSPGQAARTFSPPWTNRVGLFLAIAWPVQCGLGMMVIS